MTDDLISTGDPQHRESPIKMCTLHGAYSVWNLTCPSCPSRDLEVSDCLPLIARLREENERLREDFEKLSKGDSGIYRQLRDHDAYSMKLKEELSEARAEIESCRKDIALLQQSYAYCQGTRDEWKAKHDLVQETAWQREQIILDLQAKFEAAREVLKKVWNEGIAAGKLKEEIAAKLAEKK